MPKNHFRGSNINLVKSHNLQVVLLSLLYEPGLSRAQLAERTNLSSTTITNLIAELIAQGVVSERQHAPGHENHRSVGRPPIGICLNPDSRLSIGVHIGIGMFRVGLANLQDQILHNRVFEFDRDLPALRVLQQIAGCIETVIGESGVERKRILGVGIGASGLVDFSTGENLLAPNLNWRNVPMGEVFQNALNLPVVVDNNVRAMAIGETYFGAGRGVNSLAFVYGRVGVGAGLVFDGKVFRGSSAGAGEIGHTVMLLHGGERCHCGNCGCLETLVSEPSILSQAESLARHNPEGILAQNMGADSPARIEGVFAAARQGDQDALHLLDECAYYLGAALTNVVNLFNPELILLGGIFSQGQDLFIQPTLETVREMSFGGLGEKVRLQATTFGWKAGVIGAAALALIQFFYQPEQES
ncbi:MAG: ROK family transcriptional regulator [Anaerolineales bacterium]|nr:ROK family transcriptional regulator [Anaerolineales bacterium]